MPRYCCHAAFCFYYYITTPLRHAVIAAISIATRRAVVERYD